MSCLSHQQTNKEEVKIDINLSMINKNIVEISWTK